MMEPDTPFSEISASGYEWREFFKSQVWRDLHSITEKQKDLRLAEGMDLFFIKDGTRFPMEGETRAWVMGGAAVLSEFLELEETIMENFQEEANLKELDDENK